MTSFALSSLITLALAADPGGASPPFVPGTFERVAVTGDAVMVLARGRALLVEPGTGGVLRRFGAADAPAPSARRHLSPDEILDLYGVPDTDADEPYAEELLDDEAPPAHRRSPPAGVEALTVLAVAGEGDTLWLGTSRGLRQVRGSRSTTRTGLTEATARLAATADGRTVAAHARQRIVVSTDGGHSFRALASAPRPPLALALTPDGSRLFTVESTGVVERPVDGSPARLVLPGPARDVRACGARVLVLADAGVFAVETAAPVRLGDPLPARRLACAAGAASPVVAVDPGLLVSSDGGRSFRRRAMRGDVRDAAVGPGWVWLVTEAGLSALASRDLVATAPLPARSRPQPTPSWTSSPSPPAGAPVTPTPMPPPTTTPPPPPWASFLPRVTLVAAADADDRGPPGATDRTTRRLRLFALATFPLDRPAPIERAAAARSQMAAREAERRARLRAEQAVLPPPGTDPEADAERARLVAEEGVAP